MLNFIKSKLWKRAFDQAFRLNRFSPFMNNARLDEKRYYWREHGESHGLLPGEASFKAFEDFANIYYRMQRDHSDALRDFDSISDVELRTELKAMGIKGIVTVFDLENLARGLANAATFMDESGNYTYPRTYLSERWIKYLDDYEATQERMRERNEAELKELAKRSLPT